MENGVNTRNKKTKTKVRSSSEVTYTSSGLSGERIILKSSVQHEEDCQQKEKYDAYRKKGETQSSQKISIKENWEIEVEIRRRVANCIKLRIDSASHVKDPTVWMTNQKWINYFHEGYNLCIGNRMD